MVIGNANSQIIKREWWGLGASFTLSRKSSEKSCGQNFATHIGTTQGHAPAMQ